MSIGIGAILFLVSLGYGLQNTILERITTSDSLLTLDVSADSSSASVLDEGAIQKIKETPGVGEVSIAVNLSSQGKLDDLTSDIGVTITDPAFMRLGGIKTVQGELISNEKKEGIVVSQAVASIFGKSAEEMIGKEMTFVFFVPKEGAENSRLKNKDTSEKVSSEIKFKIIGETEGDDNIAYINALALPDIKIAHFSQVKVKCQSSESIPSVRDKLTGDGFSVSSLSETVDQANKIFDIVKIVLMLFGIIALIVSAIGMFNTMTITLLERTEEIGIMKSIGASDIVIYMIFVLESTIMGFLGGVLGIIIGFSEGKIFNLIINIVASYLGGQKMDLFFSPLWFLGSIMFFSAFVGFITGIVPARRASRIDPLEALRYK
jgi:ABC-type antimicrobial peptide transport system permease subunit